LAPDGNLPSVSPCLLPAAAASSCAQVRRVGLDSNLLEVSGTLEVFPRRTILVPATLLLPEVIPIRATLQIGVDGPLESGAVELVVAKWVSNGRSASASEGVGSLLLYLCHAYDKT
jgi:hypothetical protein